MRQGPIFSSLASDLAPAARMFTSSERTSGESVDRRGQRQAPKASGAAQWPMKPDPPTRFNTRHHDAGGVCIWDGSLIWLGDLDSNQD